MQKLVSISLALALLLTSLPASALAAPSSNTQLDPSAYLNPDGSLSVPANLTGSFDLSAWDVRLDPGKGIVLSQAFATAGAWTSLGGAGTGLNASVRDIVFSGGVLYAGGTFTNAGGDADADYIAKFSGGAWSSLAGPGTGLNNYVEDIEIDGGTIYVGGGFTDAGGDTDADNVAKFSGGVWSSLAGAGTGLNSHLYDIEFSGGVLYAGGNFINAGGDAHADYIAKFTGGVWSSLDGVGTGMSNYVIDVEFNGGVVYASGNFTDAGGDANADYVAQFSAGSWSALGGVPTAMISQVYNIEFNAGVLYAGGDFANAGGDADADRIAKFSAGAWSSLGGAGSGLNGTVYEIEFNGSQLIASGNFVNAGGDADADHIAVFSGGDWSSLGGPDTGLNAYVFEINVTAGVLYSGGVFSDAGGDTDADGIAQFGLPVESSTDGGSDDTESNSQEIKSTGTTTFSFGRAYMSVPASAIPPGETNCKITAAAAGKSAQYGFTLDDAVYDIKIVCDSGPIHVLYSSISVCIRPKDGVGSNKTLFHSHDGGGFVPIHGGSGPNGYVCGTTSALSLFTLGQFALPDTGFAPGAVTHLSNQPAKPYLKYDSMLLEIPQLGLSMSIWGVPLGENGWDVSWLGPNAGYLVGTAFPTWVGNSVVTAHVWNADNTAGPFYQLKNLQYGDQFFIHTGGSTYVYEVRSSRQVSESNLGVMKDSQYSLITLITCEAYNENGAAYLYRRAVQAVLVDLQ